MFDKLIFVIPVITLALFFLNIFYKGNTVQSCLLFVLTLLPLMDLKISSEAFGGFKTFDFICYYCLLFLLKDFITINLPLRNEYYLFLFLGFIIITLLGSLASEFPERTALKLLKIFPIFIFGRFFITECLKDRTFHFKAISALKTAYLIALSFLFLQMIFGLKFTFYPALAPNTIDPVFEIVRYPGVFYDSQAHGQYLAMGSFLFLYLPPGASRKTIIFNYAVFVLAIGAIAVAGSRAAFGGFAIGMFVVFLMAAKQYRIYGGIIVVVAALVFTIAAPSTGVFDRAKNLSEDYLFRQSIWKEAFDISKKHPYLGIGTGNYQNYIKRHKQDQYLEIEDGEIVYFDQPENGYLKIMVEHGFIGFGFFMLIILTPVASGFIRSFKHVIDRRVAFIMACLISWLVAFNTVYSIYDNRLLIMVASMVVLIITYPTIEFYGSELAGEEEL